MIQILLEYLSQSKVMWKLRIIIKLWIKRESWVHKDNVSEEDVVVCQSPGGLSILFSLPRRPVPSDDDCIVDGTLKPSCRQASDSGPFSGLTNVRSVCRWLVCRASWTAECADAGWLSWVVSDCGASVDDSGQKYSVSTGCFPRSQQHAPLQSHK